MLSRRHIRVKVLQALYAYNNDENANVDQLAKQLRQNIGKLYELYIYLLLSLEELGNYMVHYDEEMKGKYIVDEADLQAGRKLYNNPILQRLMNSGNLHDTAKDLKVVFEADRDLLRKIFLDLKNQDAYRDYMNSSGGSEMADQEVLIFVLKHYTSNNPLFEQHLEEQYYNWSDDKKIALQMAQKTVQLLAAGQEGDFLLPVGQNPKELYEYADELFKTTIRENDKLQEIITPRIPKWEPNQVAVIDLIILKMGVCEFLHFMSIPATVTINEYVELAKIYSTSQSKKFINGVLDTIRKELKKEGVLLKN